MFSMFKWPIGRAGRGTMFLWLLLGSLGFSAIKFLVFHRIDIGAIQLGLRSEAIAHPTAFPLWYVALEAAFDLALLVVAIARLHDIGKPGWWLFGFVALAALSALPGLGFLILVGLILWLALLFWPGTFGPNAYGPHPLGWESREQYEQQMRELREHVPPGKA
ncbi:uncharacterized membrane protein YhaH (DUF805 family) [Sphingomonas kyeonggiensis]|uniref:DUF805 domain-containing protein n=1 Tax=Sphingomonas kyeonggiensis TaxID=1268553 RepID=UPI00278742D4|nr:DUF805 domain-containing protein [Sphingomonas kyeonggiensis]MDQ0251206.1 uncharacterized membrane protein YhaH (DUF805 family) [Sphingomonas kyeonggiensis]